MDVVRSLYDDSPARAHVALTAEEVDDLLLTDASYFLRDPRRVRHLLTRMKASFTYHISQMRKLQSDIEHMRASVRNRATPVSAALDALRQLTLDEQRQVFDLRAQTLIDAVETARADAERARTAATSEANRTRFALARVVGDPEVSADVRAKVHAALRLLPEEGWVPVSASEPEPVPQPGGGFVVAPRAVNDAATEKEPGGLDLSDELFGD